MNAQTQQKPGFVDGVKQTAEVHADAMRHWMRVNGTKCSDCADLKEQALKISADSPVKMPEARDDINLAKAQLGAFDTKAVVGVTESDPYCNKCSDVIGPSVFTGGILIVAMLIAGRIVKEETIAHNSAGRK